MLLLSLLLESLEEAMAADARPDGLQRHCWISWLSGVAGGTEKKKKGCRWRWNNLAEAVDWAVDGAMIGSRRTMPLGQSGPAGGGRTTVSMQDVPGDAVGQ